LPFQVSAPPVDLFHGQSGNRIVPIDEDDDTRRVSLSFVETAGGEHDLERRVAKGVLERLQVGPPGRMSDDTDVGGTGREAGESARNEVIAEADIGVLLQETVLPEMDQMLRELRATDPNDAPDPVANRVMAMRRIVYFARRVNRQRSQIEVLAERSTCNECQRQPRPQRRPGGPRDRSHDL
jgi:hypothetical protein